MRDMRLLAAALAIAALAQAQTYEIVGTATEPGVGGIGGIPIYLARVGDRSPYAQTTTDARGVFRFSLNGPGSFEVGAVSVPQRARDVVQRLTYYLTSSTGGRDIKLDAAHPRAEVSLTFLRYGQITGLVLNEETREPVVDFPLSLYGRNPGSRAFQGVDREAGRTDRDGRFTMRANSSIEYVIGTRALLGQRSTDPSLPDPTPDQLDPGYSDSFWPGNAQRVDGALPVRVPSGGIVDVGTILLHKVPQYKIRLFIPQGDCPEGESVRVMLFQKGALEPVFTPNALTCGSNGVLRGLDPGSYTLYAVSDWQGERDGADKAVWAVEPVIIADKDQDVRLTLARGITLEGRLTVPDGTILPSHPGIGSRPAELIPGTRPPMEQFIEWTGETTFRLTAHPSPQELSVQGLPRGGPLYVKEVRYNGIPVRGDVIPIGAGGGATLEIVMDDKSVQLSGTVVRGPTPPGPTVVILHKFLSGPGSINEAPFADVSGSGQFTFPNVGPGEYRILALSLADRARLQSPEVLERALASAEKVTIAPGETKSVTVRLTVLGP